MNNLSNFFISVRNVTTSNKFGNEPGAARYLEVADGQTPNPDHAIPENQWVKAVTKRAGKKNHDELVCGDILIFVHGYNNSMTDVMERHDLLQKNLRACGFKGAIVSFDWPSATSTLNYLEDRSDAEKTASQLVTGGIFILARNQLDWERSHCDIDVHLLGHSTGAYVIREAFYKASYNKSISRVNWQISQIAFIGGDIARKSLSKHDNKSQALFKHSIRITNYQNPYDSALKLSNIKRLGAAPRVGRVGIPQDAPDSIVNVNTGSYWKDLTGASDHSWHFGDLLFAEDLCHTIRGDIDRNSIPTRVRVNNELILKSA